MKKTGLHIRGLIEETLHGESNHEKYEQRQRAAVEALIEFFIDTRGCSRLVAAGYAMMEVKKRYDELADTVTAATKKEHDGSD